MRPRGPLRPERRPPRRPDEMSCRDERDEVFASPVRARSLLTVRAAISLARFVDAPRSFVLHVLVLAFSFRAPLVLRHAP